MQKLIYENILGQQAVFCHAPYVLCSLKGMGLADVDIASAYGAYQQGESILRLRREKRTVQLTLHVLAGSRAEMYALRSQLCGVLSPALAFDGIRRAKLIYENDHGSWWTWAVPENGLDWGKRVANAQPSVALTFVCESPFWYGAANTVNFMGAYGGFQLPMTMPFTLGRSDGEFTAHNQGHSDAPARLWLTGCGETPQLTNLRTGAALKLIAPLPEGDVLAVCTDPAQLKVTVIHADGTEENGFGLLDPQTSLTGFVLKPGINRIRYQSAEGTAKTRVLLEWDNCYEGV